MVIIFFIPYRTLIFASPIQEICPSDPFQGRTVIQSKHPPNSEEAINLPVLTRLRRSLTEREAFGARSKSQWKHHRTLSTGPEHIFSERHDPAISLLSYDGRTIPPDYRQHLRNNDSLSMNNCPSLPQENQRAENSSSVDFSLERPTRLTRSLTERRVKPDQRRHDRVLRKSFTDRIDYSYKGSDSIRTNLNMETSL